MSDYRIGLGYDIHRLAEGRKLILGGVNIDHIKGLAGHSDADVIVHAVMDSILGAAALGDIGQHFPDTDSSYKDADSLKLLARVKEGITGYSLSNDPNRKLLTARDRWNGRIEIGQESGENKRPDLA